MSAYECMCMCTWRLEISLRVSLNHCPSYFLRQGAALTQELSDLSGGRTSEYQGFSFLYLPSAGVTGLHTEPVLCVYLDSNACSHACKLDTLPTEPSRLPSDQVSINEL